MFTEHILLSARPEGCHFEQDRGVPTLPRDSHSREAADNKQMNTSWHAVSGKGLEEKES